ncbi:ferrous iron transport protein A [Cereibacter changlensis]|uniref:Ferrous iron transport protein A n=1 Tax=Cereibacter changlensis TaxID=402884 RepID=A0A4U0YYE5_9RHOB|nr:FeoA family protein [Cereibacter changlensis]TKA97902.1 ferrous iron transport protein A [Cereibacter changlensis]
MTEMQMPLTLMDGGGRGQVTAILGGREMQRRLSDIGILIGREVEVIRRGGSGPLVVAVGDTRLALGQEVSRRIFVSSHPEAAACP